jgi:lipopolysaccharide export system permease protein
VPKTVDRYLLRSFMANYLLSLFVMISLYITLDLFVNLDEFTEESPPLRELLTNIASFYGYNLFLYFSQISGVITLFAAALTLARMQRANEMTALLSSGTSMYRIAAPVIAAGLAMNVLWIVDQEVVLPRVAYKLARPRDDVEGRRVYGVWSLKDGQGRLLSAVRFYPANRQLARMMVIERDEHGMLTGVITADLAKWDARQGGWALSRGMRIHRVGESMDMASPDEGVRRESITFYKSELNPDEIVLRQSAQWINFLSLSELAELQRRNVVSPGQVAQIRHTRFTQPINNLLLLLLGIVFFLRREPSSVIVQGGKALAVCATCFVIGFVGVHMIGAIDLALPLPFIGAVQIPPALPAWFPMIVFSPVCVLLLDSIKT